MDKKLVALFLLVSAAMFFLLGLQEYINIRPQSIHQWRQTVCLNIALNYAEQDNSLLQPETNLLNADNQTTGIAQGEFPIFYYIIGKIWKLTGQQEWIYRISTLLIYLLALYSIADVFYRETKSRWFAVLAPSLFLVPPVLAYYSVSFLIDGVALSTLILGWYAFYRYRNGNQKRWLLALFLLFMLTGLFKVTLLISPLALLSFGLALWLFPKQFAQQNSHWARPVSVAILVAVLINVCWYAFAIWYNKAHNAWFTENGIYPVWELTAERWDTIVDWVSEYWYLQYAPPKYYVLLGLAMLISLFALKSFRKNLFFIWVGGLTFLGSLLYVLLWIQVFHQHDYYVIALYPFVMMVVFFSIYKVWFATTKVSHRIIVLATAAVLAMGVKHTRAELHYRLVGWPNQDGVNQFASYFDLEPYLRNTIGIDRYQKVVAYSDYSVCISLYLCDQKGWQMSPEHDVGFLLDKIKAGARYISVNDATFYQLEGIGQIEFTKIGQHKNIDVLRINNP